MTRATSGGTRSAVGSRWTSSTTRGDGIVPHISSLQAAGGQEEVSGPQRTALVVGGGIDRS